MKIFVLPDAVREYTLKADTEKSVVFVLKPIGSLVLSHLVEKHKATAGTADQHSTALLLDLLQHGLKDVRGTAIPTVEFEDITIPYVGTFSVISAAYINRLSVPVIQELAAEIAADNFLTQTEQRDF